MTVNEVAEFAGLSPRQVRHLIQTGFLKAKKKKTTPGYLWVITEAQAKRVRDERPKRGRKVR